MTSPQTGPLTIRIEPSKFSDGTPTVTIRLVGMGVVKLPVEEARWLADQIRIASIEALPD